MLPYNGIHPVLYHLKHTFLHRFREYPRQFIADHDDVRIQDIHDINHANPQI